MLFIAAAVVVILAFCGFKASQVMGAQATNNMKKIVELFEETEKRRREHWLENIGIKFDVLRREGTL